MWLANLLIDIIQTNNSSTAGSKLVVNQQIYSNTNSTNGNSATGIKFVLVFDYKIFTTTNSTDGNSTNGIKFVGLY